MWYSIPNKEKRKISLLTESQMLSDNSKACHVGEMTIYFLA